MPQLPNYRHELFVKAYLLDPNGGKSAVAAGYSSKQADKTQHAILARPDVQERLAELRAEIDVEFKIKAADVLKRLHTIATGDARDLTQYRIGACRYCHGAEHEFQWKTRREFELAVQEYQPPTDKDGHPKFAEEDDKARPSDKGGFGYRVTQEPDADCPECAGLGVPYVTATDTRKLSADQAMLYAGAKQTQHGIEIAMQDRAKPLEMIAKHLGLAKEQVIVDTSDRLSAGLTEILARLDAAAPIRRGVSP